MSINWIFLDIGCYIKALLQIKALRDDVVQHCPCSELFWSAFSRIWTEYGEILHIQSKCEKIRARTTSNIPPFLRKKSQGMHLFSEKSYFLMQTQFSLRIGNVFVFFISKKVYWRCFRIFLRILSQNLAEQIPICWYPAAKALGLTCDFTWIYV